MCQRRLQVGLRLVYAGKRCFIVQGGGIGGSSNSWGAVRGKERGADKGGDDILVEVGSSTCPRPLQWWGMPFYMQVKHINWV